MVVKCPGPDSLVSNSKGLICLKLIKKKLLNLDGKMVYLDYNATTPLAPEVLEEITKTLKDYWGNPSSTYELGKWASSCIHFIAFGALMLRWP